MYNSLDNPISKWQENVEVPGLTLYDLNRKPREKLDENILNEITGELEATVVHVSESVLESIQWDYLKCPICLDVLDSTWTVTACLHRFCSNCLHRCLRTTVGPTTQHHECPACRTKVASRRSSKPDANFDELIQLIEKKQSIEVATGSESVESPKNLRVLGKRKHDEEKATTAGIPGFDPSKYRDAHLDRVEQFRLKQDAIKAARRSSTGSLVKPQHLSGSTSVPSNSFSATTSNQHFVHLALFPALKWVNSAKSKISGENRNDAEKILKRSEVVVEEVKKDTSEIMNTKNLHEGVTKEKIEDFSGTVFKFEVSSEEMNQAQETTTDVTKPKNTTSTITSSNMNTHNPASLGVSSLLDSQKSSVLSTLITTIKSNLVDLGSSCRIPIERGGKYLSNPFLKVNVFRTVRDLKQFLLLRCEDLQEEIIGEPLSLSQLEVAVFHRNKDMILNDWLTIKEIVYRYWDSKSELILYYRAKRH